MTGSERAQGGGQEAPSISFVGAVIAVGVGVVLLIAVAEIALRFLYPQWSEFSSSRFEAAENVPGHGLVSIGRPGYDGRFSQNNGDFRISLRINADGLRNDEPAGAADQRVWFVGDSMTFGWGVEREEIYSSVTQDITGVPTYNVASPGTNICGYQALVGRMPAGVTPKAVIVGLIVENDLLAYDCAAQAEAERDAPARINNTDFNPSSLVSWKVQLTRLSALYNFFTVSVKRVGGFVAILKSLGLIEPNHQSRHFVDEAVRGQITSSVAAELIRLRGQLPGGTPFAVVVVPSRFEIRDQEPYWVGLRESVTAALVDAGIQTIVPVDAFVRAGFAPTHFKHDGHWSVLGHRIAATAVAEWMQEAGVQ